MVYNILTVIKIKKSKNKITWYKLCFSYFFWTYPILYSIPPMFLSFRDSYSFGIMMIYLRIPPISITAILIIGWTIYIPIHNKQVDTLANIKNSKFKYIDRNFDDILRSKRIFQKGIVKTNKKYILRIENANNEEELLKIIADIQGWFISKDKFSWMWLKNKQKTQDFYLQIFNNVCFVVQRKLIVN